MDQAREYTGPDAFPSAILMAVFSTIAILLNIPPLVWHWQRANVALTSLIVWVLLLNLFNLVNSLTWPNDDVLNWFDGRVICDIQAKVMVGAFVGISCSLAAIMRSLANIMDTDRKTFVPSAAQRRREKWIEGLLCWLPPVFPIALQYIVQPNRYYIFAVSGCSPSADESWLSIVLIFIWPPAFALLDAYYATLLVHRIYKYRKQFADIISTSDLTKARFTRLFVMAMVLVTAFTPLQFFILYTNLAVPRHSYSWSAVHPSNWSELIIKVPTNGTVLYDRWLRVACGVIVFLYFGMSADAVKLYKSWLTATGLSKVGPMLSSISISSAKSRRASSAMSLKLKKLVSVGTSNISSSASVSEVDQESAPRSPLSVASLDRNWGRKTTSSIESVVNIHSHV